MLDLMECGRVTRLDGNLFRGIFYRVSQKEKFKKMLKTITRDERASVPVLCHRQITNRERYVVEGVPKEWILKNCEI